MGKRNYDDYDNDLIENKNTKSSGKKANVNHSAKQSVKHNGKPVNKTSNKNSGSSSSSQKKKLQSVSKTQPRRSQVKVKRSGKAKFFMGLTTFLVICCIAVTAFIVCFYLGVFNNKIVNETDKKTDNNDSALSAISDMMVPDLPERTTFLIAGTDEDGTRTDTIMVGCYNSELEELSLMSIPRDTLVYVDDETFAKMNEHYPEPGQQGMKINALRHYGTTTDEEDDDHSLGMSFLKNWVEETIGAKIDYTIVVNFKAFTYLIDAVGGIEYNVPMRMYYRCDEGLLIDLQPGLQKLNGEQAQGLVRFRHDYINGDIGRVEQQQSFMKELIKQLGNKETILKKPIPFITAFFKYVETDMSISDAGKFASVFKNFNGENVVTYTLPGDVGSLYGISGGWIMNETEATELSYEIFNKPSNEIKMDREAAAAADKITESNSSKFDDKTLEIQVLNGSYTNGLATKTLTHLKALGYNAMAVGDYTGDKTENTRIYVKEDGMAQSLVDNFSNTNIIVDSQGEFTEKYDVVIVLGTGEVE